MKKIIKRVPSRTSTTYQCGKCKTKYRSEKKALQCESQTTEEKLFKLGDRVTWREQRFCTSYQPYYLKGNVRKISGPLLPDEEYNIKWLGSKLSGKHVFVYVVKWRCPYCKEAMEGQFYSLELRKIKTR